MDAALFFIAAVKIAAVGALLSLDRTAWGQLMLSRPIITAPLIGLTCGNATVGLFIGALIELLWINELPVGATIPSDDTLCAVIASGVVTTLMGTMKISKLTDIGSLTFMVLAVMTPLAAQGRKIDALARRYNERIFVDMETRLLRGSPGRAVSLHLKGLLHFLTCNFVTILGVSLLLLLAMPCCYALVPENFRKIMSGLLIVFPLVGIATVLSGIHRKNILVLFILLVLSFSFLVQP